MEEQHPVHVTYQIVLLLHSWLRYAAIACGIGATLAVWKLEASTAARADRWGRYLTIAVDVQMLLGVLLYFFLSPMTIVAVRNWSTTLRNPWVRFFALDHVVIMAAAVVLVHVGRVLARKAATPETRRARLRLCFGLALIAMIAATPWPGTVAGRPLFHLWQDDPD